MPPVTADDNSSPVIAYLIIIPVAILFAGTGIAITCSEKWNKHDNRLKRFLRRRKTNKKRPPPSAIKSEDTTKTEEDCCEPVSSQGSENTIVVPDPRLPSGFDPSRPHHSQ
jgi:hypothetical protein